MEEHDGEHYETVDISGLDREGWLQARHAYIGGSDAATVVGKNPWRSPFELALDKLGALPTEEERTSEAAYWGNQHERTILAHLLSLPEYEHVKATINTKDEMYISKDYPWAVANLDGLLVSAQERFVGVEVKTASEYKRDEWASGRIPGDGRAPIPYQLQCQHYMAVRPDIEYFVLAGLVGGNKFYHVILERDDDLIVELMRLEEDFMDMVASGHVPDPTGSDRDRDILTAMNPDPEGETVLDDEWEATAVAYSVAAEAAKEATARKKSAGALLLQQLGSAKKGYVGSFVVNRIVKDTPEHMVKASHSDYITVKETRS